MRMGDQILLLTLFLAGMGAAYFTDMETEMMHHARLVSAFSSTLGLRGVAIDWRTPRT